MMFRIYVECCFLFLLVRAGDTQYDGEKCSFNNSPGVCSSLRECPSLLALVQQQGLGDNRVRDILRKATCSYDDAEPFVCCVPASSIPSVDEVVFTNPPRIPTPKPIRPTTSRPNLFAPDLEPDRTLTGVSRPAADGVLDVSRHRNLRLLPSNCGLLDEDRIWGGNRTSLFEFPWMVLIAYDSARGTRLSCAGTLISRKYVLTAAHCVSHLGSKLSLAGVVVGEHDVRRDPDCERVEGELMCAPPSKNVTIQQVIAHPNYTPQKLFDDIALLRLAETLDFNQDNLKAVCLPTTRELAAMDLAGIQTVVTGWGSTENGLSSPVLLKVELPVQTNSNCSEAYRGTTTIYPSQLCAGGVPEKDSCGGDSGGPLQYPGRTPHGIRYIQHGIVSYGSKRCGIGGFPGVYTRVSHYMNWILNNMTD